MLEEYKFRQALNGWIVTKEDRDMIYNNRIWVFNSMEEMGQWVTSNFKPAEPTPDTGAE